jgi:hypothetical protein
MATFDHPLSINEDSVFLQAFDRLAVFRQAFIDARIIHIVWGWQEFNTSANESFDRTIKVARAQRDIFDSLMARDLASLNAVHSAQFISGFIYDVNLMRDAIAKALQATPQK